VTETLPNPTTLNDRYVIERQLGSGAFVTLYVARDLRGGGRVLLKVLRRDVAATAAEQFLHGAEVVSRLQHPNILSVIDSGRGRGRAGEDVVYSAHPYVNGRSLRERLEREPQFPLDEALRIAGGVARALEFAHREDVVHEDLKPESILFRDGEPVVDFGTGLPTSVRRDEWRSDPGLAARAASYMSPEQLGGQPGDTRSDQYALAAVIYEMLAGQAPFTAPTAELIAARALTEPPPPLTALRVVPRIVERAINRALAKAPADRFQTIGDLLAALHGAASTPALPTATLPPPRRRWRAPLIASLVILAVGAGVAMASRAVVGRRASATAAHSQLTFTGAATSPVLSPDGRSVAYIAGGRSLLLQRLGGGEPLALVPSAHRINAARWTGDGRALVVAMTRDSTERPATFLVPAGCSPQAGACASARKVLDDVRPFDAGPDSTVIVRAARDVRRLEIVSLDSGKPTGAIAFSDSIGEIGDIAWSPDRRWIAFTDAGSGELWVVAAGGGTPSHVAEGARAIRWASGSDALYFLSGPAGTVDLMRVRIDAQSGRAATNAARVTSLLASDAFDVGRDSRLVHTQTSRDAPLRTFAFGGTAALRHVVEERPLSEGTAQLHGAAISPDGRWVAYGAARGTERDVHVVAFGGGSARVVAASPAREEAPAWSPDGTRLTYAQQDSTGRRVMLADARTGAPRRIGSLPGPGGAGSAARWSASGRHIAYYADDLRRIALLNLQRRNESVVRLPDNVGAGHLVVVPSPNGTQLIASTRARPDEPAGLWLVHGNGRRWRRVAGPFGEALPVVWHRNGWIYLVRNRGLATDHGAAHVELWRMRGPTGRPELYAALPEGCGLSVSISADASRGVCNYVRVESDLYVASTVGTSGR
jgi:Tol biopolymer transport system component